MKYFIFSFMLHFSVFALVVWKNHQPLDIEKKSRIIIEIISLDSDNATRNLSSKKTGISKKLKKRSFRTHLVPPLSKKRVFQKSGLMNSGNIVLRSMDLRTGFSRNLPEAPEVIQHRKKIKLNYVQQLKTYIEQNKFYPRAALRLNQTGVVKIRLEIAPDGLFKNVTIVQTSVHENLNRAALKLVKNLRHFKPLPGIFKDSTPFIIPIAYMR